MCHKYKWHNQSLNHSKPVILKKFRQNRIMSIIAQLFTTSRQLPSGKIVPCQDLIAARKAINPQDLKHEASGCCCITTGTIDHSEHNFTIAEVVEILEAVFGGTFGSTAKVDGNTFRVTSWAE